MNSTVFANAFPMGPITGLLCENVHALTFAQYINGNLLAFAVPYTSVVHCEIETRTYEKFVKIPTVFGNTEKYLKPSNVCCIFNLQ